METKSIQITPPEGYEIDKENSTFEEIVFKSKRLTYKDVCKKLFVNNCTYFTSGFGSITISHKITPNDASLCDPNNATSKEQLKCVLAKNKLANVARYLNGNWEPSPNFSIFLLVQTSECISVFAVANGSCASNCGSIWFKSEELAKQAIEILGEEEVKLALKPLY